MQNAPQAQSLNKGEILEVMLPSTKVVTIREINGDDEGILSTVIGSDRGENFRNFLANIIEKDNETGKRVTPEEIGNWKANDLYYLILAQRIMNHGEVMKFKHKCSNPSCKKENEYEEDLKDLLVPDFTLEPEEYVNKIFKPYPAGKEAYITFTLKTGKVMKFTILTPTLENYVRDIPQEQINNNTRFLQRELKMKSSDGEFKMVGFFSHFNAKEMAELRAALAKWDYTADPIVEIECGYCKNLMRESLMNISAFYYPEEQI